MWRLDNLAATRKNFGGKTVSENIKVFTDEELLILSDGIRSLVANADKASQLVKNKDVHKIISEEMQKYSDLEVKVCMMMGKI